MLLRSFLVSLLVNLIVCKRFSANNNPKDPVCDIYSIDQRFDCFPEDGANEDECVKRGCCWSPHKLGVDIEAPYCYFPRDFQTYQVINQTKATEDTASYLIKKPVSTFRPKEILNLKVDLYYDTDQRLRVKIYDPNNQRYEVPLDVNNDFRKSGNTDYYVHIEDKPFAIKVFRKSNNHLIFDTSVAPLLYADQFIQFSTSLPNNYIYGVGEHRDSFQHLTEWSRYSIWNRDIPPIKNYNLYGAHPFYMCIETDGNAYGFFLLNSNGMDVILQPYPAITFLTIGGVLDFFIYMGPTPQDVVQQHMLTINKPFMPPYFSLGFHLCRWNYKTEEHLKEVILRNRLAKIPYDTQWTDIDVMDGKKDWTYDNKNFPSLPQIVEDLHNHGQHYINIIDPAISTTNGYAPYENGLENGVFIKYVDSNQPLVGEVWPGETVYPDFTNPNTTKWWTQLASDYHSKIPFDGLWIDMNEPSNFVDGSLIGCTNNTLDEPPYIPKVLGGQLYSNSICPSSQQYLSTHYNLHNMYGHFEAIASNQALKTITNKRPFVLTRSSYSGTGAFSAHWTGDNKATWDDLYFSIPSILNFNMFGVTMVGADICGYAMDTTEELCIRWTQLGSFYPFMRNHNDDSSKDQDPGAFGILAQDIMRSSLFVRYELLPYMYTMHYRSHAFGETVVRPLFFEFPKDVDTHSIDKQFLFGPALLISPVLQAYTYEVDAYFPNDTWYDLYTGEFMNKTTTFVKLDAPLSKINAHVRGGYILPKQHAGLTTTESRKNPFSLLVALSADPSVPSYGSLFWDDGESLDTIETNKYNLLNFYAVNGKLQIQLDDTHNSYQVPMMLDTVTVYGVATAPSSVMINGQKHENFVYDDLYKTLKIQYFYIDMFGLHTTTITWN